MGDGTGVAEALLGLTGVGVLGVDEMPGELVVTVETTTTVAGCVVCGTRAVAHERIDVAVGDLSCFGSGAAGVVQAPVALPRARV